MRTRETDTGRVRGTTPGVEEAARQLRRRETPAERVLWQALRRNRLRGLAFRRQHPLGPFVVDFYCPARRLVVELDGEVHDDQAEQDEARTERLIAFDYRVIRFRNDEVLADLHAVLAAIMSAAAHQTEPRPVVGNAASDH